MRRELGGVIACMQELEIACNELNEIKGLQGIEALAEIKRKVRNFFGNASKDSAQEVAERIRECQNSSQNSDSVSNVMNTFIKVDGVGTTLLTLCDELTEILEDLA